MNNVFQISRPDLITNKYDLKGSLYKRKTKEKLVLKGHAKKELNFLEEKNSLKLSVNDKNSLMSQLEKDSSFLAKNNIIDYSLLLGIVPASSIQQ